jgi:hypothetical protein
MVSKIMWKEICLVKIYLCRLSVPMTGKNRKK